MRSFLFLLAAVSGTVVRSAAIPAELSPNGVDSMTTEKTGRWTNCGASCPAGFQAVPRNGGHAGEMMWDHSHCRDGGLMTFCCPTSEPQPVCAWRGHKNSGRCSSGCNRGEAEVWTLKVGCARAYCCKGDSINFTPPAFSQCRWRKDIPGALVDPLSCNAACPPNYTKLALRKEKCSVGEDAFCCKGYKPSEIPDIRNPSGKPQAPKKSAKDRQFEDALESYIKAYDTRQCPADEKPRFAEWLEESEDGQAQASKPEFTGGDPGNIPALPPCLRWSLVGAEMRDIVKRPDSEWTPDQKLIVKSWERAVPSRWPGTSVADLAAFLEENPISSPDDVVNTVFYGFDRWVGIRKAIKTMKTKVCVEVQVGSAAGHPDSNSGEVSESNPDVSALNVSDSILRRYVQVDLESVPGDWRDLQDHTSPVYTPWLGRIFEGIRTAALSLHYARWEWYRGNPNQGFAAGPFLELAYWIGPVPGRWSPEEDFAMSLWRYRDLNLAPRNNPGLRDRWVVFHLHFDSTRDIFWDFNGHTYAGYTSMTVFHAHSAVMDLDRRGWRVDGSGGGIQARGNTGRNVLRCPWDSSDRNRNGRIITRMWIGANRHPGSSDPARPDSDTDELFDFHNRLFRDGYINRAGMLPIIDPRARNTAPNQHFELQQMQYPIVRANPTNVRPPGDNIWARPYGTNFRLPIDLNQRTNPSFFRYNYDIDMPNPAPQPIENPWDRTILEPHGKAGQTAEDAILGKVGSENVTNGTADIMS